MCFHQSHSLADGSTFHKKENCCFQNACKQHCFLIYSFLYRDINFLTAVKSQHKSVCSQMLFGKQNRTKGKRIKEIRNYLTVPLKHPQNKQTIPHQPTDCSPFWNSCSSYPCILLQSNVNLGDFFRTVLLYIKHHVFYTVSIAYSFNICASLHRDFLNVVCTVLFLWTVHFWSWKGLLNQYYPEAFLCFLHGMIYLTRSER